MATHDPLTGLPNRTLILDRAEQMLARARRNADAGRSAVHRPRQLQGINDTLGHAAGDELLRAIAARLDGVVRDTDTLGRLGGDEFVVLAEEFSRRHGRRADRRAPAGRAEGAVRARGGEHDRLTITASIGVASRRAHRSRGAPPRRRHRDVPRQVGRARTATWSSSPACRTCVQSRMALEMDLRAALAQRRVLPRLPADVRPARDDPDRRRGADPLAAARAGLVQPNDFIPLLEETGLIVDVGRWVLEEACRQGASWRDGRTPDRRSPSTCRRASSTPTSSSATSARPWRDSGFEAQALTLEITETALMRNAEQTARAPARRSRSSACASRSTTSAPATPRSPTCSASRRRAEDRPLVHLPAQREPRRRDAAPHARAARQGAVDRDARRGHRAAQELSLLQEESCDSGQGFLFARPLEAGAAEEFLRNWCASQLEGVPEEPASRDRAQELAEVPAGDGPRSRRLLAAGEQSSLHEPRLGVAWP